MLCVCVSFVCVCVMCLGSALGSAVILGSVFTGSGPGSAFVFRSRVFIYSGIMPEVCVSLGQGYIPFFICGPLLY